MTLDEPLETLSVPEEAIADACGETPIPSMGIVEQVWDTDPIPTAEIGPRAGEAVRSLPFDDVPVGGEVALRGRQPWDREPPGDRRRRRRGRRGNGLRAVRVPGDGSHGGATAAGQTEMLAELGVTESAVGCEIRSTMAVVEVGRTPERDVPVVADAEAVTADAIVPINRIKPHTDFDGTVESGLSKMLVIGMGKQRGAKIAHDWAVDWSLREMIPAITPQLLSALPVVGGVAIVEDQHDDTARLEGIPPGASSTGKRNSSTKRTRVCRRSPSIPSTCFVPDRQGKDISGQGIDTNVIGRRPFAINEPEPDTPEIKRIFTRSLTETTHGNAMGVGSADVIHEDILAELDATTTLINALTASTIRGYDCHRSSRPTAQA